MTATHVGRTRNTGETTGAEEGEWGCYSAQSAPKNKAGSKVFDDLPFSSTPKTQGWFWSVR